MVSSTNRPQILVLETIDTASSTWMYTQVMTESTMVGGVGESSGGGSTEGGDVLSISIYPVSTVSMSSVTSPIIISNTALGKNQILLLPVGVCDTLG